MKKMFFALVAMVMMAVSVNAQSSNNNSKVNFDRLASYLELTVKQYEPVKMTMAQLGQSMEAYYQLQDASKGAETWEKIQVRHKATMKKILNEKQYDKYVKMFDKTVKNPYPSDHMTEQELASK